MEWIGFRDNHTNDSRFECSTHYANIEQVMKKQTGVEVRL
jgi:head-tail adaptor